MKNRFQRIIPNTKFDSSFNDVKVTLVKDGEITSVSAKEDAKKYDWRVFQFEELVKAGVELKPMTVRHSVPLDVVGDIEMNMDSIKFVAPEVVESVQEVDKDNLSDINDKSE